MVHFLERLQGAKFYFVNSHNLSKLHPDVTIFNSEQDIYAKKLHGQFHDDTPRRLTFRAITSKS